MHVYFQISSSLVIIVTGIFLILGHAFCLLKGDKIQPFLLQLHRNSRLANILTVVVFVWLAVLFLPASFASINLTELNWIKKYLYVLLPVAGFLFIKYKSLHYLSIRMLATILILIASLLLQSTFQQWLGGKLLISVYAYFLFIVGMILIVKPFLFRDMMAFFSQNWRVWQILSLLGLVYGIAVLTCYFT